MTSLFFSYSHEDEDYRDRLEKHLAGLQYQGLIDVWHDRRIPAGGGIDDSVDEELNQADVVLLLISASFLSSRYCVSREMEVALQRHREQRTHVIPVMLKPCDWHYAPFKDLKIVPRDAKAITSWSNEDEAFRDAAIEIRKVVEALHAKRAVASTAIASSTPQFTGSTHSSAVTPANVTADADRNTVEPEFRSSNMRVRRDFTDYDRDSFALESFDRMSDFFEASLKELELRHSFLNTQFRKIDGKKFTASVYKHGKAASECTITLGGSGHSSRDITYSDSVSAQLQGYNESLMLADDEQRLFFRPMHNYGRSSEQALNPAGAAEYYWAKLMAPLQ
jgi:hypothetical protein